MTFVANHRRVPIEFQDDYLQRYITNGELDINELSHRFGNQVIGVYIEGKTKAGETNTICTPYSVVEFSRTLGRVPNQPDPVPVPYVRLHKIGTDTTRNSFTLHNHIFQWDIPKMGVLNYRDSVVFAHTDASRQWRRGLDRESLIYEDPLSLDSRIIRVESGTTNRFLSRSDVIKALYNPVKFSFHTAYEKVRSFERRAAAFNNKFFIANTILSNDLVIGYRNTLVGTLDSDGVINLNRNASFLLESLSEYRPCRLKGEQK